MRHTEVQPILKVVSAGRDKEPEERDHLAEIKKRLQIAHRLLAASIDAFESAIDMQQQK